MSTTVKTRRAAAAGALLASALALALGTAASPTTAADRTTPSSPGAGYTLDWENPADWTVPEQAPPGWRDAYTPSVRHANGEPQVRAASAANGEPVRAGGHSARFELDKSDPVKDNGSRAEIKAVPVEPAGAERWYGFSTYLPSSWVPDPTPEIIAQWHQTGGDCTKGCSPPLAIFTKGGKYYVQQSWQNDAAVPGVWTFGPAKEIDAYATGRWTDWVVHVKWSLGNDGILEIWKDDQPIPGFNPKIGRNDDFGERAQGRGNYLVLGIYKWPWSQKDPASTTTNRVLYTDELRITDQRGNYNAVAPPAASPVTQLSVTGALQITPATAGRVTQAKFTVINNGATVTTVPYFLVGARTTSGGNVDFPAGSAVTLQPGQSHTYRASQVLPAGSYTAWPAYYDDTTWHELAPRTTFTETS